MIWDLDVGQCVLCTYLVGCRANAGWKFIRSNGAGRHGDKGARSYREFTCAFNFKFTFWINQWKMPPLGSNDENRCLHFSSGSRLWKEDHRGEWAEWAEWAEWKEVLHSMEIRLCESFRRRYIWVIRESWDPSSSTIPASGFRTSSSKLMLFLLRC